jgi:hypothetical protein
MKLRILIYPEYFGEGSEGGRNYLAVCLERNLCGYGRTVDKAYQMLEATVSMQGAIDLIHGNTPLYTCGLTSKKYHDMFNVAVVLDKYTEYNEVGEVTMGGKTSTTKETCGPREVRVILVSSISGI